MFLRRASTVVGATVLLAACSAAPTVTIESYRPIKPEVCAKVMDILPGEVLTQGKRKITKSSVESVVAAWGDPVIVLKCGVTTPDTEVFMPDVITVNSIDWRYEELEGGTRFYSDSLQTNICIDVPVAYDNPVDVLVDLSTALQSIKN